MKPIFIYDSSFSNSISLYRGGGRIIQVLRENLPEATFTDNLSAVPKNAALLIPSWSPFTPPPVSNRIAEKQILMIFDVIPLKYPSHFPIGIRGNFNLWRNKRALKNFDKIITISYHSKKDIVKHLGIPEEKIEVAYPTLSKVFLDNKIQNSKFRISDSKFCLYVGDVNWNKNLVNLARAIKIANVACFFVGKPFDPKLPILSHSWLADFKQFLEIVKNDKRFIFLGYAKDDKLTQLYQQAFCNILISQDEGFGYSYAEAASQHCPSILSDIAIFHETAGEAAFFANPNDPTDIANTIDRLHFNKEARSVIGSKAAIQIKKFSPYLFKQTLLQILYTN